MEEKQNTGGWLKKVAGIFVEIPAEEIEVTPQQTTSNNQTTGTGFAGFQGSSNPVPPSSQTTLPNDFVEDLRNRFKKVLEEKNQAGFDFYEFSMMLLRSSSNPSSEQFKTAFEGAKMLNPNCTNQFLLSSADFYKKELQTAYQNTVQTGEQKKQSINTEKATEQKQLNADLGSIDQNLTKLKQEILNLEKLKAEKTSALQGIDNKFNDKLQEIEQKIIATATAKDGVLTDILLIENGVKNYL